MQGTAPPEVVDLGQEHRRPYSVPAQLGLSHNDGVAAMGIPKFCFHSGAKQEGPRSARAGPASPSVVAAMAAPTAIISMATDRMILIRVPPRMSRS